MDKITTCFFTGHRDIPHELFHTLSEKIDRIIDKLYLDGYRDFITGGAVGFDTLAALAVIKKREKVEGIRLHVYIPCENQDKYFSAEQKETYQSILNTADSTVILSDKYFRGCMQARNRKMADNSSLCIAYCTKQSGGSAYTLNYAIKNGLDIVRADEY